ncbi:MAG: hypothetical protein ACI855_005085, partial [Myxococcota bacterium]
RLAALGLGALRYDNGTFQVCNGSEYAAIGRSTGVVDYQYAFNKAPSVPTAALRVSRTAPLPAGSGHEVAPVSVAARNGGNFAVIDGQVVYGENGNSASMITIWGVGQSDGAVFAAVGDSVHSTAGGCVRQQPNVHVGCNKDFQDYDC